MTILHNCMSMGKALYRSHRPRNFDGVIGQEHITDTLKNAVKKGAISHAYLFTGPRGTGKTSIARILAHVINGIDYDDESMHLDIIEIDAASNRRIDEIRELRDKVHIAPTSSKYKVYIIDEVHMLTREAFNALLKTLEEPPEHAVFILATTEAHKVPETIVSRTQKFTFKPIDQSKVIEHLRSITKKEKIVITDEALRLLAEHGQGSFRDSISMLDQLAGFEKDTLELADVQMLLGIPDKALIEQTMTSLLANDTKGLFDSIQELKVQGVDSGRAAMSISSYLRSEIMSGSQSLPYADSVRLLKNLLPLTLSSSDFLGLELALLEQMKPAETLGAVKPIGKKEKETTKTVQLAAKSNDEIVAPKKEVKPPEPKPEEVKYTALPLENIESTYSHETEEAITVEKNSLNKEVWEELLNDIKKKHNTLYGVLRMAEPIYDGSLTLRFQFGFHKKQIDIPQNTATLRKYIELYFNTSNFTVVVSKDSKTPVAPITIAEKSDEENAVTSVSNIFGGAELLE